MYNIHALREQWDYYTIASKLTRVIQLYVSEYGLNLTKFNLVSKPVFPEAKLGGAAYSSISQKKFKQVLLEELGALKHSKTV